MKVNVFTRRRLLAAGGVGVGAAVSVAVAVVGTADASIQPPDAPGALRHAGTRDATRQPATRHGMPNSDRVVLRDGELGAASGPAKAHGHATRHGGAVKQPYDSVIKGSELPASEETARRYAGDPQVAYVEANQRVH